MERIKNMIDYIEGNEWNVQLFFVSRILKKGVKHHQKLIDKYDFLTYKVDLDTDISNYFQTLFLNNIIKITKTKDVSVKNYEIISDDMPDNIYTYALNNSLSFSDVIMNQLPNSKYQSLTSLKEIKGNLWAYILKIEYDKKECYCFRKMSSSKITRTKPKFGKEKISSYFDSNDMLLRNVKDEQISFDDKIDCIYLDNIFFIFKKGSFEALVGLEDELKENADEVIETLRETGLIEGISIIESEVNTSKRLLIQLASIAKKELQNKFSSTEIDKMKDVLKKMEGKELKLTADGRIHIEDSNDLKVFIKLLNDFYKQGLVTGNFYGTSSGSLVKN